MRGEILKSATESHDIQQVLENENLVRKQVSEGEDSLFRAFSEGLYFTPNYFHQIKDLLIRNLSNLITTNTLPTKLEIFRGNSVLWNDYSKNPSSPDFFRINLELFSLAFKIRVVVYTVTTDGILNAKIFNNKFDKSVQFINPNSVHLDAVYNKDTIQNIESSNDPALKAQAAEWKETCAKDSKEPKTEEKKKESFDDDFKEKKLKKTKSDSDLRSAKDHLDLYNMFVDLKSSEEFSTQIEKDVSKLGQTADPNLIPEPRLSFDRKSATSDEQPHQEKPHLTLGLSAVKSFPNDRRVILEEEDEDLPSGDAIKFEKSKSYMDPKRNPMHFGNQIPPGLTPNRYSTKTYGTEVTEEVVKPRHRFSESHAHPVDLVQQPNGSHLTPNSKHAGRPLNLNAHSEEFNKGNVNAGESSSHDVPVNPPLTRAQSQRVTNSEKKKPVIIDESQHRYTGRLKFFDEGKSYGFIVMDDDGSDIFVHYDDLHKANINKEFLRTSKFGNSVRLSFACMEYIGKYNRSRKATDIQFLT